ncbi:hypothetical protein [Streptomyces sp. NPDC058466]|uniref:hypothetical protein n=1 Tax=unclassified Streptomyces TaxID=2593676 RepID=UPI0036530A24
MSMPSLPPSPYGRPVAAQVTAHPEGAGAVAVAVAAALSARREPTLDAVAALTPDSAVREGPVRAADVPFTTAPRKACRRSG